MKTRVQKTNCATVSRGFQVYRVDKNVHTTKHRPLNTQECSGVHGDAALFSRKEMRSHFTKNPCKHLMLAKNWLSVCLCITVCNFTLVSVANEVTNQCVTTALLHCILQLR